MVIKNRTAFSVFLSTLSLRRATCQLIVRSFISRISIHALLAESDGNIGLAVTVPPTISIHALLAESDSQPCCTDTTSAISIHALLAESDRLEVYKRHYLEISIHALLAESDAAIGKPTLEIVYFYPRSPCGERPVGHQKQNGVFRISIHALLAESDIQPCFQPQGKMYFYPRSPCGERPTRSRPTGATWHFYPRSPCGERHIPPLSGTSYSKFLSTLSLRRATTVASSCLNGDIDFYPRSPCGERRWSVDVPGWILGISIHALLAESDDTCDCRIYPRNDFYPRSPCGERHMY